MLTPNDFKTQSMQSEHMFDKGHVEVCGRVDISHFTLLDIPDVNNMNKERIRDLKNHMFQHVYGEIIDDLIVALQQAKAKPGQYSKLEELYNKLSQLKCDMLKEYT